MRPERSLPFRGGHQSEDAFVQDLLQYASECKLLQILCGGVHILDFLIREPDLYSSVLPSEWRAWLAKVDILDLIDLLNKEDVDLLLSQQDADAQWRGYEFPPKSMLEYISSVHKFIFDRSFSGKESRPRKSPVKPLSRALSMGMKSKKIHEVEEFSAFVKDMVDDLTELSDYNISDVVDFGAGQGYLGRSLASPLFKLDVVSVESKAHNIEGAKKNDILAKISKQEIVYRNKRLWRAGVDRAELERLEKLQAEQAKSNPPGTEADQTSTDFSQCGTIRHIEHIITGGDLAPVVEKLKWAKSKDSAANAEQEPQLMVISLHSCGNLLHHGLRSLVLNDSVKACAMIGCCYNLCTERLGSPTYKLPGLRTTNRRLLETSNACDADGYPMSERFATFEHNDDRGIRLNITARMMGVQAPRNWTKEDTESFFTKHFYRALLQRIFLDHKIIEPMVRPAGTQGILPEDLGGAGAPITIGALSKGCFKSFVAYVRGALKRLVNDETRGESFRALDATLSDEEIEIHEQKYQHRRHDLCVLWSFMAFSAGVVETLMVTDRWQWLREQEEVADCWVQTVFDYGQSPRNLAVIGIKA